MKKGRKKKPTSQKVKSRAVYLTNDEHKIITNTYGSNTAALRVILNQIKTKNETTTTAAN